MHIYRRTFLGNVRTIFWPIKKRELRLFIPMAFLMFCTLYNFSSLRSIKDGLVVTQIGAEVISFLKFWLVLPSAIIFTILYARLSNSYSMERVFHIVVSFFLVFFALFAFVLYPYSTYFHPNPELITRLVNQWPHFQWFIKIFGVWSYALMYIFSELWSVVVINLMFWQFANHITSNELAKRFYPVFGLIGNLGLVLSGNAVVFFTSPEDIPLPIMRALGFEFIAESEVTLKFIISTVIFFGLLAMLIYNHISNKVVDWKSFQRGSHVQEESKTKLTLSESIKLVMKSKYVGYIALLIICYGLAINIVEGPWKDKIREVYPTTNEYIKFMGRFNMYMGFSCVIFMVIGSNMLRIFGWTLSALVTPIMLGITGGMFFGFILFGQEFSGLIQIETSPVYFAVMVGALQNILSKSSKYSLFDSTKEMAYIPLSLELRTKGKAAAEVMGIKFGKSMGAFLQSMMFMTFPVATFENILPYMMIVFFFIITIWIFDVKKLGKEYNLIIGQKNAGNS